MRRSVTVAAFLAATLLVVVVAAPVAAFPLSTCSLALTSTDATGTALDSAAGGAPDSTVSDPFRVEWDGVVAWDGSTGTVIKNYTYHVEVFGVPTPIRGGDSNDDENIDGGDSVGVGENAPFRVAGLYFVSGEYTGEGGTCTGSGWFQLLGNPIGTVPWIAGIILTVLGVLGLVAGARGHAVSSILGGLSLGLGLDLLLTSHSVMPMAENTPLAVLLASVALGVLIAVLGRQGRRGAREPG